MEMVGDRCQIEDEVMGFNGIGGVVGIRVLQNNTSRQSDNTVRVRRTEGRTDRGNGGQIGTVASAYVLRPRVVPCPEISETDGAEVPKGN